MSNNSNRRRILLGLELANGSLDGPLQMLETMNGFAMKPAGDVKNRNVVRGTMSQIGSKIGAKQWDITLPTELHGGGEVGGVIQQPPMHSAFLACGMVNEAGAFITVSGMTGSLALGETLNNTTAGNTVGTVVHTVAGANVGEATIWVRDLQNMPAVTDALAGDTATATVDAVDDALVYRPESDRDQHRTAQLHAHYDSQRRITKRMQGTLQFDWQAGDFATVQFSFKGLYERPDNTALPDAEYNDQEPPLGESAGLTLAGYPATGTIEKLGFQLGHEVVPVPDINSAHGRHSFRIASRKSTGSIDPESVDLGQFDPFAFWEDGTKAAIHATLGSQAGERISVLISSARFTGITDKVRAGGDAYDLPFEATGKNDDEFYLFFH